MQPQRLQPRHAPIYRELMLEAYGLHPDAFTSSVAERSRLPLTWWESRLSAEPQAAELVLGAFLDGALAGVVGLSFESREKLRHKARLFGMYVPANRRGNGLGTTLVQAALDAARLRSEVRTVHLTVSETNQRARSLYEKCGFVAFGLEPMAVAVGPTFVSKVHMDFSIGR